MTINVTVTERAAHRIGEILGQEPNGTMLRISVEGGGCSGFQYKLDLVDTAGPEETRIVHDGAVALVDDMSAPLMAGSMIDYVEELVGSQFKILNPLAVSSCGCGTSFAL